MAVNQSPIVICPTCGKEQVWDSRNRYRPFCSERCKLVDLGRWANEEYRIEQHEQDEGNQSSQA